MLAALAGGVFAQTVSSETPEAANQRMLGLPGQQGAVETGPVQLRPPANRPPTPERQPKLGSNMLPLLRQDSVPSEFERFVQSFLPADAPPIRRFGAELVIDPRDSSPMADFAAAPVDAIDASPIVPGDYAIRPGDEIALAIWGSAEADLKLLVDRSGRIVVPRVGAINLAGVRYADLHAVIDRRVAQVFRNYQMSVSLGQLRGVRVFVTGFVKRPGNVVVNSLSSVLHVLMRSGGPNAAGSFRDIQLWRGGAVIGRFDLVDLMLKGDRSADQTVQSDDVIHIGPVGSQVAVIGSVNQPVVVELKNGEGIADALRMAGGFNAVADRSRVTIERLSDRSGRRVAELNMADAAAAPPLSAGDLIRVFSAVSSVLSKEKQNRRVRIEGEVLSPGDFVLPPGSRIADAIRAAGGMTPTAYVFGTEFNRDAVRQTQQENLDRALRDFETQLASSAAGQRVSSAEESGTHTANARLVERLRQVRPTGRVVLQLQPHSTELPDLPLEEGDRIYIPSRSTTVGVFGSVFSSGSFLFSPDRNLDEYMRLAGGPTRGADTASAFVIRPNGSVVSVRQNGGWFGSGGTFADLKAEPGDTIFVPEELNKTTFLQAAKDWTQVFYQFGLGIAAAKTVGL